MDTSPHHAPWGTGCGKAQFSLCEISAYVMRNSVLSAPAADGEKSDCLMPLSEFLLGFFDRISGIMTDAYIAEQKRVIARRTAPM